MLQGLSIHPYVANVVLLWECTHAFHVSCCVLVVGKLYIVHMWQITKCFHKAFLQIDLLTGFLLPRQLCSHQAMEFVPHETAGPFHEYTATRFIVLEVLFQL